jgi:hypothetical protein
MEGGQKERCAVANLFPDHADMYHTGIVVHDLERAKAEMSQQLGIGWGIQGESEQAVVLESGPAKLTFRFAYSERGPHRIELVQAIPGTLWEVPWPGSAHHLGYWSDDVPAMSAALTARGLPLAACVGTGQQGGPVSIVMHRAPSGLYVELVDRSLREMLFGQDLAMY